jgi:type II secretory pathway pseudopilin PulG
MKYKFEITAVVIGTGILASIAVPNLLQAMNRSSQKRTMADVRTIATAWEARATDFNRYSVGQEPVPHEPTTATVDWPSYRPVKYEQLRAALSPTYIKTLPRVDGWGRPFEFVATTRSYAVRSRGRDGRADTSQYASAATTSFDKDIVYSNGAFIWFPEGT